MKTEYFKDKYMLDASLSRLANSDFEKYKKYASSKAVSKAKERESNKLSPFSRSESYKQFENEIDDLMEFQKFFNKIQKIRIPKIQTKSAVISNFMKTCSDMKNSAANNLSLIQRHIQQGKKLRGKV